MVWFVPVFDSGYSRVSITAEVINSTMASVIIKKQNESLFLETAWSSLRDKKELEITLQQHMLCDCTSCVKAFKCKSL